MGGTYYQEHRHIQCGLRSAARHGTEAGFTLIETLVAIMVLLIALAGPLTLAQQSLQSASISADQITAFYLAQDAMEYVRNVRDTNLINGNGWMDGLNSCFQNFCSIDTSTSMSLNQAVKNCTGYGGGPGNDCRLGYDPVSNRYGYNNSWSPSRFWRQTKIEQLQANAEVRVTTTVTWQTGDYTNDVTVSQSLFNIQ